ncbi:MAG TPA: hypothetical protein VEH06_08985 [Candidatus Bathyarchaeia archaeon]|nr:hypothetical protein [Candidatus Bathyarchaeia archaeon]
MKIPKYSCSTCGKPSTRRWNLYRHINDCHSGIGECLPNWDFSVGKYRPHWNGSEKAAINQKVNFHHIRPDLLKHFLSLNDPNDIKPGIHQDVFIEAIIKELARKAVSAIQLTQSRILFPFPPNRSYYVDPAANLQIFGFRGYACDKCLAPQIPYVAFPNDEGQGRIEEAHFCYPTKAAAVDRSRLYRSLHDEIPTLIKRKVNSRTLNNNQLVTLRLSDHEETIKLPNPASSKPAIVFPYSEQTHVNLELDKENKNKCDYFRRAIQLGSTPLSDEEFIDFLKHMRNATFGVITKKYDQSQSSLSYFVYVNINVFNLSRNPTASASNSTPKNASSDGPNTSQNNTTSTPSMHSNQLEDVVKERTISYVE